MRSTTSKDSQGSAEDVRRRKVWLVDTYRADVDLLLTIDLDASTPDDLAVIEQPATPANVANAELSVMLGSGLVVFYVAPAARCYRCGCLVRARLDLPEHGLRISSTITPDRIVPGCVKTTRYPKGGTYAHENIRPACLPCNTSTGGALGAARRNRKATR